MRSQFGHKVYTMDLSQLTDTQLTNMETALVAEVTGAGDSYTIGQRTLKRRPLDQVMKALSAVQMEIRLRADTSGGLIYAEFGDPE